MTSPNINNRPAARLPKKAKPKAPKRFQESEAPKSDFWKDQLAAFRPVVVAREELGIADTVNSKEAGEIIEAALQDTSPTEDLAKIADRVMAKNGMAPGFSETVNKAATAITQAQTPDHDCVVDLLHLPFISTDNGDLNPETGELENASQDIDQVEYADRLPNDNIRVLVGIADVDSLVKKGDILDKQAMRQGATVYTDDKIYPMLHPNLSENHTSLNEGENRLVTMKEFQVTPDGEITEGKIFRAFVRNRAQLAYDSTNEFLTDGSGPKPPQLKDPELAEQITLQNEAAQRLKKFFYGRGSLDIESSEGRAQINNGKVKGIKKEVQTQAKDKVKFNMMAANMTTMRALEEGGYPTLRRVVKTPEKWDKIVDLAKKFNFKLPSDPNSEALNKFLEFHKKQNPGAHEELCANVVRLVGRGEYVVSKPGEPMEGHFCLAVHDYGHTTAPNRRGPDLVNQRIEKAMAQGDDCPYSAEELEELALHFNRQEEAIKQVERRVHRSASAKLMKSKIGQTFDGRFHKSLPNGTLVRLQEPYVTGLILRKIEGEVGDEMRVKLNKVDVEKGHIDFSVAKEQLVEGYVLKD